MDADEVITTFKRFINADNLDGCRSYLCDLQMAEEEMSWDYIFQKVYLHACLKKRQQIVDWLMLVYDTLPPIEQIAIRQVFPYGRHLLSQQQQQQQKK